MSTKMRAEIEDIPNALQRLLDKSQTGIQRAADDMRDSRPNVICTVARGSSDHAATYLKYAIELGAHVPVASIGPSVSSIYGVQLDMPQSACIAISQSGQSPDITSMTASAKEGGAITIGITNDPKSPLADAAQHMIELNAGKEESVAATKTFVTSIVAGLLLLGHWKKDDDLLTALHQLPELSAQAIECDWANLQDALVNADSLYVLGRGPSFAIANEVALKFKETCLIHGEAFSSAEVLHGPVSIVESNYPVLALVARDRSQESIVGVADGLVARGGNVFATSDTVSKAEKLPFVEGGHSLVDPLLPIISFYAFVEKLARRRGLDPDTPRNLKKVTETI